MRLARSLAVPLLAVAVVAAGGRCASARSPRNPYSSFNLSGIASPVVDGLIVIDAAGTIQYVNPGCEKLFRYKPDELIGRNVSVLMPVSQAATHDGYLSRHRDTRVKRIIGMGRELSGLKSDGTVFPMYLSVGEAETADGVIFVGIIYDLTEKKRAEERFDSFDTNKDGKLSREEVTGRSSYLTENFDKLDADKDGFLSWEEFLGHNRWPK